MFNLVKAMELALNGGRCIMSGEQLGPAGPTLAETADFDQFQAAFKTQIDSFFDAMLPLCNAVDKLHAEILPSPFLSALIDNCIAKPWMLRQAGQNTTCPEYR